MLYLLPPLPLYPMSTLSSSREGEVTLNNSVSLIIYTVSKGKYNITDKNNKSLLKRLLS